ncbi:voltage-gated K+ channel beta subunit (KCNAB) [Purpureocillium lavendulum]|uniref:diphosphomevalonate decarboxylase n=1 Tax=Purpureocillium lavendulum TaxID=1247861 RepID=A0AB34FPR3_9HYPO|nr:voltage-gated K+ channel beta subunit (KCNAB) [Purpureocillium lavendulum]
MNHHGDQRTFHATQVEPPRAVQPQGSHDELQPVLLPWFLIDEGEVDHENLCFKPKASSPAPEREPADRGKGPSTVLPPWLMPTEGTGHGHGDPSATLRPTEPKFRGPVWEFYEPSRIDDPWDTKIRMVTAAPNLRPRPPPPQPNWDTLRAPALVPSGPDDPFVTGAHAPNQGSIRQYPLGVRWYSGPRAFAPGYRLPPCEWKLDHRGSCSPSKQPEPTAAQAAHRQYALYRWSRRTPSHPRLQRRRIEPIVVSMADTTVYRASTTAPVNIAVVKYWGKRDPKLNLPTNSSLSVTLSQADLRTLTTASCAAAFGGDSLTLNGELSDISGARTQACFRELRARRAALEAADPSLPKLSAMGLKLVSENNFPTAAGLASSAAGFAALVQAIANLYELPDTPAQLSIVARQGSGSACRSLFGGYVAWRMGDKEDGSDSMADLVAPASHWPNMRALILVVSAAKKGVSSTSGMQQTVATSGLFQQRIANIVPANMATMEEAIQRRDFAKFAEVTMRESNSFHACCADTYPPIFYMNDISKAAIRAVESINAKAGKTIAAYTFDAGPNCVVYYLDEEAPTVLGAFSGVLGGVTGWKEGSAGVKSSVRLEEGIASVLKDGVSRVIMTSVGEGPIKTQEYLVDEDGQPAKR